MFFSFIISENFEFYFMNALVYVDIDRGIHMIRIKVAFKKTHMGFIFI